jgi:hypothetical protein
MALPQLLRCGLFGKPLSQLQHSAGVGDEPGKGERTGLGTKGPSLHDILEGSDFLMFAELANTGTNLNVPQRGTG